MSAQKKEKKSTAVHATLGEGLTAALANPEVGARIEPRPASESGAPVVSVRKLVSSGLLNVVQAVAAKTDIKAGIEELRKAIELELGTIGDLIRQNAVEAQLAKVFDTHDQIVKAVLEGILLNGQVVATAWETLAVATMDAMIAKFPTVGIAQQHIGYLGNHIGYLHTIEREEVAEVERSGKIVVWLPVATAAGPWRATPFTSDKRDSRRILGELQKRADKIRDEEDRERSKDLKALYTGAAKILEASKSSDSCEATGFSPDQPRHKGGTYPGGHIRVKVQNKRFYSTGKAVGKCSGVWRRIAEASVYVTLAQVESPRLDLRNMRLRPDDEKLALSLHGLVRSALVFAREKAAEEVEDKTLQSLATVPGKEWDRNKASGLSYFFVEDWVVKSKKVECEKTVTVTKTYRYLPFVMERRESDGFVKVAACLKTHESIFAPFREFADPGENFANLGIVGGMLRTIHFFAERDHRRVAAKVVPPTVPPNGEGGAEPSAPPQSTAAEPSGATQQAS